MARRSTATGHRRGRSARIVGGIATAMLLLAWSPPAVAAAPTDSTVATWGARVPATDDVGPGAVLRRTVAAGSRTTHVIEIFNLGPEPRTFEVFTAAAVGTATDPDEDVLEEDEAISWLTPRVNQVTIAPRSSELIEVALDVPVTAALGRHEASIMVSPLTRSSGSQLTTRSRVALVVDLEVAGEIVRGVYLGALESVSQRRTLTFEQPVTNTGNVSVEATGRLLIERGGTVAHDLALGAEELILSPGGTGQLVARLHPAPWLGRLTARPEVVTTIGGGDPITTVGEPVSFWIVPWAQLLGLLAAVVLLTTLWATTRESRHRWLADRRADRAVLTRARTERRLQRAGDSPSSGPDWALIPDPADQPTDRPAPTGAPRATSPQNGDEDMTDADMTIDLTERDIDLRHEPTQAGGGRATGTGSQDRSDR